MKDAFFSVLGAIVIIGSFYLVLNEPAPAKYQPQNTSSYIKIGSNIIKVEVADNNAERQKGLSGRISLPEDSGVLFIFEEPGIYGFWMKNMNFPIDIVWIDESWRVASIERGISPQTFPETFYPSKAIKYVLEINSGEASRLGIDMGQVLYFERQN